MIVNAKEESAKEGLPVDDLDFSGLDNAPCRELIEGRPKGLFPLLEDECQVPNGFLFSTAAPARAPALPPTPALAPTLALALALALTGAQGLGRLAAHQAVPGGDGGPPQPAPRGRSDPAGLLRLPLRGRGASFVFHTGPHPYPSPSPYPSPTP